MEHCNILMHCLRGQQLSGKIGLGFRALALAASSAILIWHIEGERELIFRLGAREGF